MVGATDWSRFAASMTGMKVTAPMAGYSLSGLHDLVPISRSYLQKDLGLTGDEVERNSPVHLAPPSTGAWLAMVGDREGPEYHRQSAELAARWTAAGLQSVASQVIAGHDHFSIVAALADPDDPLTLQIADGVTGR